ncbi:MAG TPA: MT-A70 family methyltransferase [Coleofasciculaceae cyanobacterium]|jgi:N6-adenosine-specific RNA methylase IME4
MYSNVVTKISNKLTLQMAFIRANTRNGKNYYSLVESKRVSGSNTPRQKSKYLGTYQKACLAIKELNISQDEKENFLLCIKEKEGKQNPDLYNLPTKKYSCIVIDPPWFYKLRKDDNTHRNRIPYPPMKIEEILKLPIPELCEEKGTVLWLWFTNNHMIEAGECIQKWGFTLKTILTWEKISKKGTTRIGTGHWLRNCTEHCILATHGNVTSFSHSKRLTNEPTILKAPRREHSRKPDEFYSLVEHLCDGTRLEMFARQQREGWDTWGNEVNKFDRDMGDRD